MRARSLIILVLSLLLVTAASLPARADSISNFNFSSNLIGASGSVSGSFAYDNTAHSFTSASLTFNSPIFGNVVFTASNPRNGYLFIFSGSNGGTSILYSIIINPLNLSQFWLTGGIWNLSGDYARYGTTQVPEGEEWFLFLIPAVLVIGGAFLLAAKQRTALQTTPQRISIS